MRLMKQEFQAGSRVAGAVKNAPVLLMKAGSARTAAAIYSGGKQEYNFPNLVSATPARGQLH